MKKFLKKSKVLHEGYIKGLKEAHRIIKEAIGDKKYFSKKNNKVYFTVEGTSFGNKGEDEKIILSFHIYVADIRVTRAQATLFASHNWRGNKERWSFVGYNSINEEVLPDEETLNQMLKDNPPDNFFGIGKEWDYQHTFEIEPIM